MKKFFTSFATICIVLALTSWSVSASDAPTVAKPSPDQALTMLKDGNARFVAGKVANPHSDIARAELAGKSDQGNYAYATILSCSDSRVPVERIFDAGIMDVFIIRVAGNVMNVDETGSIEYGLAHVKTPVLVVLGHSQCGAVKAVTAAVQGHGHALERNIPPLVASIEPAVRRAIAQNPTAEGAAVVPFGIEENVWQGIENLLMNSAATRDLVNKGSVKVVGALYDVGAGTVNWLPEAKVGEIMKKVEADPKRAMNAMAEGGH